jgi:hypothetical protein
MPDVSMMTLNNRVVLPAIGFGVFQTPPDKTRAAVAAALSNGYRHIDTAAAYGNERSVGEAVRNSELDRSEVFPETKIWISDHGYDQTLHGFEKIARKLGSTRSTCSSCTKPFLRTPRRRSAHTGLWRRCSPTRRSGPSASATSWSSTSPGYSSTSPWREP